MREKGKPKEAGWERSPYNLRVKAALRPGTQEHGG